MNTLMFEQKTRSVWDFIANNQCAEAEQALSVLVDGMSYKDLRTFAHIQYKKQEMLYNAGCFAAAWCLQDGEILNDGDYMFHTFLAGMMPMGQLDTYIKNPDLLINYWPALYASENNIGRIALETMEEKFGFTSQDRWAFYDNYKSSMEDITYQGKCGWQVLQYAETLVPKLWARYLTADPQMLEYRRAAF